MKDKPSSLLHSDPLAIARLLKDADGNDPKGLPPVHLWNPPDCGEIDMEIRRNGQWFYQGTPINRPALVRLFSTVLRRDEDGHHYLVTPVEKVRIRVEDSPFLAISVEQHRDGGQDYLRFTTQTGDVVIAGEGHPLRVTYGADGEPRPCLLVRGRLEALLSRTVYYQLVEWGRLEAAEKGGERLLVRSAGVDFEIGRL